MKNNDIINEYIKKTDSLKLDYSDIKDRINIDTNSEYRIISNDQRNNVIFLKRLFSKSKLFVSLAFIFMISIGIIFGISYNSYEVHPNAAVIDMRKKSKNLIDKEFVASEDLFLFFGPYNEKEKKIEVLSKNFLINTNLFSDNDNETFMKSINMITDYSNSIVDVDILNSMERITLYMGIKNGKDVIIVSEDGGHTKSFIFESNLDYSFIDVLNEFENKINHKLNKEFLNNENTGIYVSFKKEGNIYLPYYVLEYENNKYIVY